MLKKNKSKGVYSYYYFKFEGLNIERFLNELIKNNVNVFDIERPSYKLLYFKISPENYKKLKTIKTLKNFNFTLIDKNGFPKWLEIFKLRNGLFVGAMVSCLAISVLSLFTFNINIYGIESIKREEILNVLKQKNIDINKINNFNNEEIENLLKTNLDKISLVSVSKLGTSININIKEKLKQPWENYESIIAPYNLLITDIEVHQGYTTLNVGDSVAEGGVIVNNFDYNNLGVKFDVEPIAKIEADVWFCGEVVFNSEEVVKYKTGNKIVNSSLLFNNLKLFSKTKPVKFDNYEKVVYNEYIFNNCFLPIKLYKETFYEIKEKVVKHNFEEEKDSLIEKSKQLAYEKVPNDIKILEENVNIIECENGTKIIQTYLKSHITIDTTKDDGEIKNDNSMQ